MKGAYNMKAGLALEAARKHNADSMLIMNKPNVRFVSGYTGDDSYLLICEKGSFFLTDPRYTEQAAAECPDFKLVLWRKYGSVAKAVAELAKENGLRAIAFEANETSFSTYDGLRSAYGGELVPTKDIVERMRMVKSPAELSYLRAACDISCRAFERLLKEIRVGVTEKALAAKLSSFMVEEGADTQPYGNILISGARTSLLHGIPGDKSIAYGDLVLMDFGCQYNGYLSDMTRTVVVGRADEKQREVYELERGMVEDSLSAMKAGVKGKEVYEASMRRVRGTVYEQYTYSGIGHGIGLFVHEYPFMSPVCEDELPENGSQTIEPGIYIPGWGGIRIEDQVIIKKDGVENLISIPHELIEL